MYHLKALVKVGSINSKLVILMWKAGLKENHRKN